MTLMLRTNPRDDKSSLLKASKHWDVHIPPPSTSFKALITPKRIHRFRRISVEVHRIIPAPLLPPKEVKEDPLQWAVGKIKTTLQQKIAPPKGSESTPLLPKHKPEEDENRQDLYEHAIVRVLVPKVVVTKAAVDTVGATVGVAVGITKGTVGTAVDITKGSINVTKKGATAIQSALRRSIYRKSIIEEEGSGQDLEEVEDELDGASTTMDSSLATVVVDNDDEDESHEGNSSSTDPLVNTGTNPFGKKWMTKYVFDVRNVQIVKLDPNVCTVHIHAPGGISAQERKIFFDSEDSARSFAEFLQDQQQKENQRINFRLKASLGDLKLPNLEERRDLLIEIVGAERLSMNRHCDPFVTVTLDGKDLHHTSFIPNRCVSWI